MNNMMFYVTLCLMVFVIRGHADNVALQEVSKVLEGIQDVLEGDCYKLRECKSFEEVVEEKREEVDELRQYINYLEQQVDNMVTNSIDTGRLKYQLLYLKYRLLDIKVSREKEQQQIRDKIKSLFEQLEEVKARFKEYKNRLKKKLGSNLNNSASETSLPPPVDACYPSPCGPYSVCRARDTAAACSCLPHHVGAPPSCGPECIKNSQCSFHLSCIENICKDPCPGTCGLHAKCRVFNHIPVCECLPGYTGDPFTRCTPIPATEAPKIISCSPPACGENAKCTVVGHREICYCIADHYGDPYVGCRRECVINTECAENEACSNNQCRDPCPGTCGQNALCNIINHSPECVCPSQYTGDPYSACIITHSASCPTDWSEYLNNCYLFRDEKRSWLEAEKDCVRLGGHLASVHSVEEVKYIFKLSKYELRLWVGVNDRQQEGVFINTDASPVDYINWATAEPDDGKKDCVVIYDKTLLWGSANCNRYQWTVCKVAMSGKKCLNGWTGFNSYCYKAMNGALPWNVASGLCRLHGGQLPSIHSQDENALVGLLTQQASKSKENVNEVSAMLSQLVSLHQLFTSEDGFWTWISLQRTENGDFEWMDGSPLNFTSWAPGRPRRDTSEDCVFIKRNKERWSWYDYDCEYSSQYVCKAPLKVI